MDLGEILSWEALWERPDFVFFYPFAFNGLSGVYGGEGGIRTHGRHTPTPDFESGTFDHSATSPNRALYPVGV